MRDILKIAVLWIAGAFLASSAVALAAKPGAADVRRELAVHYYRGVVNYEAGRFEEALNEFRAVSSIDPYYKDTQKYITQSMNRLEQYRRDLLVPKDGSSYEAKGVDLYFLGKMYYEKRDYDRALEAFKAILDQNPGDKFALYYAELCEQALGPKAKKDSAISGPRSRAEEVMGMEKEIAYMKEDMSAQEDMDTFLEEKAQRRADRDEMIRKKERQLGRQEAILEEEKQGYLAEAKLAKRARKLDAETEKWRRMRAEISSRKPGIPAELTEFPIYVNKAEAYYKDMKDDLRTSRWNSAGLSAVESSLYFCDAVLIYYYAIKSAYPEHENITRLMADHIDREDAEENILRLRAILNMKSIAEEEDRPLTRTEALFLADKAERLIEWCRSILP